MSFINEENKQELSNFLISIDTLAINHPELVDEMITDSVLIALIEKASKKIEWFVQLYKQNVKGLNDLEVTNGLVSEIELYRDKMNLISRDIKAYYSLYNVYNKLAQARNVSVHVDEINILEAEGILIQNGLIEVPKQL